MDTPEEIKSAFERLSPAERESIAAWLRDSQDKDHRVAEPAAAYVPRAERPRLSVDEYLKLEAEAQTRHEYVAGEIFAMSGVTVRHNLIAGNLVNALANHLRGGPCKVFFSDVKVRLRINRDELFYYPDVMVACGPRHMDGVYVRDPRLIVEVLSPSTEATDRREKAMNYRQIASLEEYVIVAQRAPEVTIYRRGESWEPRALTAVGAAAEFRSIELAVPLAQLYAGAF